MSDFHHKRSAERGSALVLILVGVALFAALSYTVAGMLRTGNADFVAEERAGLYAGDILNYARQLKQAVQTMKISNGCGDSAISFDTDALTGYVNGADSACQIFSKEGGDVTYVKPDAQVTAQDWYFTGGTGVHGMGTNCTDAGCTDLMAVLPNIPARVCEVINDKLGIDDSTAVNVTGAIVMSAKFTGSYAYATSYFGDTTAPNLEGQPAGCLISGSNHLFYQILLPR